MDDECKELGCFWRGNKDVIFGILRRERVTPDRWGKGHPRWATCMHS